MSGLRVLVVDDEEGMRFFLEKFLKRHGDEPVLADEGRQALEILSHEDFDVLISDLSMPGGMGGLELIRRARYVRPHMVPIVLTGFGTTQNTIAALKEGVFDYVEKPIRELNTFGAAVERAGRQSKLLRDRQRLMNDLQTKNTRLKTSLAELNDAYRKLMRQEEVLESDLRGAQRMQQSLLPSEFPKIAGFDIYGYYRACDRLGGDFFDVIPLGKDRMAVYLADVAGHGVRAAMVTVVIRELIHAQTLQDSNRSLFGRPEDALAFLNGRLLEEKFDQPVHVTIGYLVIDGANQELTYSSAGHPRPILVSENENIESLRADGPALGIETNPSFCTIKQKMNPGDFILLYTDGLAESRGANGYPLSAYRLTAEAASFYGCPADEIGESMEDFIGRHQQDLPVTDDVSFLVIAGNEPTTGEGARKCSRSIKIVEDTARKPLKEVVRNAFIASGWKDNTCVIRIAGEATWQEGPGLISAICQAKSRECCKLIIDMSECDCLDSTLLGLVYQMSREIEVFGMNDRVTRQFRELGILQKLQQTDQPPPKSLMAYEPPPDISPRERAQLVLAAHETLMDSSEENQKRFEGVVRLIREQAEEASVSEEIKKKNSSARARV
jgi:serine phosphatase RsbU (regulator of sigma subunit)/anti-anti-sigma regulatory factor